jgi:hypothetical protein
VQTAQSLPSFSGWQIDEVHVASINVTTSGLHSVPGDRILAQDYLAQARTNPDYYGIYFVLNTHRVTRYISLSTLAWVGAMENYSLLKMEGRGR